MLLSLTYVIIDVGQTFPSTFLIHIPFVEEMSIGNAEHKMCLIGTIMYCIYIVDGIKKVFIKLFNNNEIFVI